MEHHLVKYGTRNRGGDSDKSGFLKKENMCDAYMLKIMFHSLKNMKWATPNVSLLIKIATGLQDL